ncbi:REP-associated tyrosine transposase [Methyloprofundus sp.]|uniref:REP-associated tyrosine transposase n=1 Tax=Methyloprofundus sp. TaxID=2020875 RepID=UPI003D125D99
MSDYRRNYVQGGAYFFTVVTEKRINILNNDKARECLRSAFQHCMKEYPFKIDAMVMLPNHIHAIWTLPDDDFDYSKRWGIIKKQFTQLWLAQGGFEIGISKSKQRYRRRGVWQRRFWEHTLRNQDDYNRHFDYLHYNPIKHGVVRHLSDYPYSSFHRCVEQGIYQENWGSKYEAYFDFNELDNLE